MLAKVVVEGHVDHAIVHAIAPALDVPKPEDPSGREAAIRRAAAAAKLVGNPRVVLLLDRNGYSPDEIAREVRSGLEAAAVGPVGQSGTLFTWNEHAIRLVLAGLPDEPLLRELGVTRFTSDDYILKLLLVDDAFRSFCAGERNLSFTPPDAATLAASLIRRSPPHLVDEVLGPLRADLTSEPPA